MIRKQHVLEKKQEHRMRMALKKRLRADRTATVNVIARNVRGKRSQEIIDNKHKILTFKTV